MSVAPNVAPNRLRGIPFVGPIDEDLLCMGDIFYVNSAATTSVDSTAYGKDPSTPFKTINYAVTQCTASNGDMIIVLPGHVENLVAAGSITVNKIGVKIVGVGVGRLRPKITFSTATTASFLISAASVCIRNFYFDCTGIDSLANPVSVTAADCKIKNCEFYSGSASASAVSTIVTNASADRLVIEDNFIHTVDASANSTDAIHIVGGNDHIIRRNVIYGAFADTQGCIYNVTTACTNLTIADNTLVNRTASCNKAIALVATTMAQVTRNNLGVLAGTAPLTAANATCIAANYYRAALGVANGTLL